MYHAKLFYFPSSPPTTTLLLFRVSKNRLAWAALRVPLYYILGSRIIWNIVSKQFLFSLRILDSPYINIKAHFEKFKYLLSVNRWVRKHLHYERILHYLFFNETSPFFNIQQRKVIKFDIFSITRKYYYELSSTVIRKEQTLINLLYNLFYLKICKRKFIRNVI